MAQRIAWLGLGTMGEAMARRLAAAGFPLTAWNRTRARSEALAALGVTIAGDPADAVRDADVVVLMLTGPAAVREVAYASATARGALASMRAGALLVDMSTCDPATERELAGAAAATGIRFVDAPVYGSRKPAEDGTLIVLAGGAAADVAELAPPFSAIARKVVHAGPAGAGAALKLSINAAGAHALTGIAVGLALATACGVDGAAFLDALGAGAFASPLVTIKGPLLLERRYPPAFRLDLMRKDVDLALQLAQALDVASSSLAAIRSLADDAIARGHAAEDLAALFEAVVPKDAGRG